MVTAAALLTDIRAKIKPHVTMPDTLFGFIVDNATYAIDVKGGVPTISAVSYIPQTRACTVRMDSATLLGIVSGSVNPTMAYMGGKLKVDGDMNAARKIGDLFA